MLREIFLLIGLLALLMLPSSSIAVDGNCGQASKLVEKALSLRMEDPQIEHLYLEAEEQCSSMPEAPFNLALWYRGKGDLEKSLVKVEQAISKRRDPLFFILRGNVLFELKKYDSASEAFKEALELDAGSSQAYQGLGVVSVQKGDLKKGQDYFSKALELDKQNPELLYNLGIVYEKNRQLDLAEKAYQAAIDLKSSYAPAVLRLGNLLASSERLDDAKALLSRHSSDSEGNAEALVLLGQIHDKLNNLDKAEIMLRRALEEDPDNQGLAINLARVLLKKSQPSLALGILKPYLEVEEKSAELYTTVGRARYELGDFRGAEMALKSALEMDKGNEEARKTLDLVEGVLKRM